MHLVHTSPKTRPVPPLSLLPSPPTVLGYKNHWLPARSIVRAALEGAAAVHGSGAIMVLERFCPWKDHLYELEGEGVAPAGRAQYMLFQDTAGSWRRAAAARWA